MASRPSSTPITGASGPPMRTVAQPATRASASPNQGRSAGGSGWKRLENSSSPSPSASAANIQAGYCSQERT